MANGIRTGDSREFNKGLSSKFYVGSRVRQTPEEGWRIYRPKPCRNNNKDQDNSPKTLNDKNNLVLFNFNGVPNELKRVKVLIFSNPYLFRSFVCNCLTSLNTPSALTNQGT